MMTADLSTDLRTAIAIIDSCVLIDYINGGPWAAWAEAAIEQWQGLLAINAIIYAELAIGFEKIEDCDEALPSNVFQRLDLPWPAAFLASQVQRRYRQSGGKRDRTLPDFLIGAHAAIAELTLITRDFKPFLRHFPRLTVIAPNTHFQECVPRG